jgi:hypothetical protein
MFISPNLTRPDEQIFKGLSLTIPSGTTVGSVSNLLALAPYGGEGVTNLLAAAPSGGEDFAAPLAMYQGGEDPGSPLRRGKRRGSAGSSSQCRRLMLTAGFGREVRSSWICLFPSADWRGVGSRDQTGEG